MAELLKDNVDGALVARLARRFELVVDGFDSDSFVRATVPALEGLELKARVEAVARGLWDVLGPDYAAALSTVVAVARAEPSVEGWEAWPLASFVELYGLEHPEVSLPAMEHITKRMSCEFAIRPFLRDHFDLAYGYLEEFAVSSDESVRRLPSEGTRPRLPWGMRVQRLIDDPGPGLALVERLRHDPSDTVRRSVANHLNDVAKDHPDLVVATVQQWASEPQTDGRMVAHALRTLVKQGHSGALGLLGFTTEAGIEVDRFAVTPNEVEMGQHITLEAVVRSTSNAPQRLVVDFAIHHVLASGEASPKVFKWTALDLAPGEVRQLSKRRLIQQASTRTYRPGIHRVDLLVAGQPVADSAFDVRL